MAVVNEVVGCTVVATLRDGLQRAGTGTIWPADDFIAYAVKEMAPSLWCEGDDLAELALLDIDGEALVRCRAERIPLIDGAARIQCDHLQAGVSLTFCSQRVQRGTGLDGGTVLASFIRCDRL